MPRPEAPPSNETVNAWRDYALEYLKAELREAAPGKLGQLTIQPWSPLDGEGAVAIFEFHTSRADEAPQRYAVVVGETEPNYYAVHDLSPDEIFELHLGTRFMLVMGISQVSTEAAGGVTDYDVERDALDIARRATNTPRLSDVSLAALFDVEGEKHAVIRARLNDNPVYMMGRDAPLGFSTRTDLAPHIVYRLHIGHVLRREAKPEME